PRMRLMPSPRLAGAMPTTPGTSCADRPTTFARAPSVTNTRSTWPGSPWARAGLARPPLAGAFAFCLDAAPCARRPVTLTSSSPFNASSSSLHARQEPDAPQRPDQVHDRGLGGVVVDDHLRAVALQHVLHARDRGQRRPDPLAGLWRLHAPHAHDGAARRRTAHATLPAPAEPRR